MQPSDALGEAENIVFEKNWENLPDKGYVYDLYECRLSKTIHPKPPHEYSIARKLQKGVTTQVSTGLSRAKLFERIKNINSRDQDSWHRIISIEQRPDNINRNKAADLKKCTKIFDGPISSVINFQTKSMLDDAKKIIGDKINEENRVVNLAGDIVVNKAIDMAELYQPKPEGDIGGKFSPDKKFSNN